MSQLSKFLGGLWADLEAPFVSAINAVKTAFDSKDASGVVNSISGLIKVGAVAIENAGTQAQATGLVSGTALWWPGAGKLQAGCKPMATRRVLATSAAQGWIMAG